MDTGTLSEPLEIMNSRIKRLSEVEKIDVLIVSVILLVLLQMPLHRNCNELYMLNLRNRKWKQAFDCDWARVVHRCV